MNEQPESYWEVELVDPDAWTDEELAAGREAYYAALDDLDAARVPQDRVARFVALFAWSRGSGKFDGYLNRLSTWVGKAIDEAKKCAS